MSKKRHFIQFCWPSVSLAHSLFARWLCDLQLVSMSSGAMKMDEEKAFRQVLAQFDDGDLHALYDLAGAELVERAKNEKRGKGRASRRRWKVIWLPATEGNASSN